MEQLMAGYVAEMKADKREKGSADLTVEMMGLKKVDPSVGSMVGQSVDG